MAETSTTQQKVLDLYHNDGPQKAWNYWKLMGNTYGIFLGEVPSTEFINGESLANHIRLTDGVLCNIDTPWLKFILDGNTIYAPMKPLMHSVSWNAINGRGAVFGNEGATINVGDNLYDITLLRGLDVSTFDSDSDVYGYDLSLTHNSEWNRLMYPIHIGGGYQSAAYSLTPSVPFNEWASYTDDDLVVDYRAGNGSYSLVQETSATSSQRLIRGLNGITHVSWVITTDAHGGNGWRPALRLIK